LDVVDQNDARRRRPGSDLHIFKNLGLLDNVFGLIIIYTLMKSSDRRLDVLHLFLRNSSGHSGSGPDRRGHLWQEIWHLLRPMTLPAFLRPD